MLENVQISKTKEDLAQVAAELAIITLHQAIQTQGSAIWVLAGGTIPEIAYRIIAEKHLDAIDWSKVAFVMGDERIVPLDSPDNNWLVAEQTLLRFVPDATFLRPQSDLSAEAAADDYSEQLARLPQTPAGLPRFDLVWLGVGEDGHTLSLFPGHPGLEQADRLVIPIHNSPKPPADRISLTLKALECTHHCYIIAAGAGKADVVKQHDNALLPVVRAEQIIEAAGGIVTWLIDEEAASKL